MGAGDGDNALGVASEGEGALLLLLLLSPPDAFFLGFFFLPVPLPMDRQERRLDQEQCLTL
jgi:hypothetical protein